MRHLTHVDVHRIIALADACRRPTKTVATLLHDGLCVWVPQHFGHR